MSDSEMEAMSQGGSYPSPSFQRARVADAMSLGAITCPPDCSMQEVARIMATNHVHAVIVRGVADSGAWSVVTDRDVLAVGPAGGDQRADACASEVLVTVSPDEPLEVACELMRAHGVSHVMVVDPQQNQPLGVVSTLDVAGMLAWGRG